MKIREKIDGDRWAEKFKEAGVGALELLDWDGIWQKNFEQVRDFVEKNGRYLGHNEGSLGVWCHNQRNGKGKLSKERVKLLKTIPGWKWAPDVEASWMKKFKQVRDFEKKNGRCPKGNDGKLGIWCKIQKSNKKRRGNKIGKLLEKHIKMLETIPSWKWGVDLDGIWQESFEQVRDFEKKNGRCPKMREGKLGVWCCLQRQQKKIGKLSEERVKLLETISSWRWGVDWQGNFEQVRDFEKKNGRCPKRGREGKLGLWCVTQRSNKKKDKLSEKRVRLLETIPGWRW